MKVQGRAEGSDLGTGGPQCWSPGLGCHAGLGLGLALSREAGSQSVRSEQWGRGSFAGKELRDEEQRAR